MNRAHLNRLNGLKCKVRASTKTIAHERDKLRDYLSDIQSIVEDIDQAEDDLKSAVECLEQATETISQQL